jgi:cyclic lactone autoinducer peptide
VERATARGQSCAAVLPRTPEEIMTRFLILMLLAVVVVAGSTGCAGYMYQPQNAGEAIKMIEAAEGSGCTYFRGNSRPYADVSFMTIHAYGKSAPKYLDCLQAVPPEARMYLFQP